MKRPPHLARPGGLRARLERRRGSRFDFALGHCLPLMKCACFGCRLFRRAYRDDPRPLKGWRAVYAAWRLAGLTDPELRQLQARADLCRRRAGVESRSSPL